MAFWLTCLVFLPVICQYASKVDAVYFPKDEDLVLASLDQTKRVNPASHVGLMVEGTLQKSRADVGLQIGLLLSYWQTSLMPPKLRPN